MINTSMTEVKVVQPQHNISVVLSRITELLVTKARHEGRAQDENNRTTLSGISFWFAQAKDGGSYLIYDSNPESWNKEKLQLIVDDIEKFEWNLLYRHAHY